MLCYSFLGKRGVYINKRVNWLLEVNNEKIINNKNVICKYNDNIVEYKENDTINIVDINNKLFHRITNEYEIIMDFINKKKTILLKEKNLKFYDNLIGSFKSKKNEITINYKNEEEDYKIIINLL